MSVEIRHSVFIGGRLREIPVRIRKPWYARKYRITIKMTDINGVWAERTFRQSGGLCRDEITTMISVVYNCPQY